MWWLLLLIVVFLTWDSHRKPPNTIVEQMKTDGLPQERIRRYQALDDYLHHLHRVSVETGVSHLGKAQQVSLAIKEEFPRYNFPEHALILKHISKVVNGHKGAHDL
jgi:hypothetical protein